MPDIKIENEEIKIAYMNNIVVKKIYVGDKLVYSAKTYSFIDSDSKNLFDSGGNQILVY